MKKIFTLLAVAAMAFSAQAEVYSLYYKETKLEDESVVKNVTALTDYSATNFLAKDGAADVTGCKGWSWENNFKLYILNNGKSLGGGNTCSYDKLPAELIGTKPIKLSNGAPNDLIIPEGVKISKIQFIGYSNADGEKSYISNLGSVANGQYTELYTCDGSTDFFTYLSKEECSYKETVNDVEVNNGKELGQVTIDFTTPVEGTIQFKNGGKQPCLYILLYTEGENVIYPAGNESGIAGIEADENAPVEYFNLQGIRVNNPENGLFIRRQGNKAVKVVL